MWGGGLPVWIHHGLALRILTALEGFPICKRSAERGAEIPALRVVAIALEARLAGSSPLSLPRSCARRGRAYDREHQYPGSLLLQV